jgi:hypothetical protein
MNHLTIVLGMIVAALTFVWNRIALLPILAVWRFQGTR